MRFTRVGRGLVGGETVPRKSRDNPEIPAAWGRPCLTETPPVAPPAGAGMAQPCGWSFCGRVSCEGSGGHEHQQIKFRIFSCINPYWQSAFTLHPPSSQLRCTPTMTRIHPRPLSAVVLVSVLFAPVAIRAQELAPATEETPQVENPAARPTETQPSIALPIPVPSAAPAPAQSDKPAGLDFQFFEPDDAAA